MRVVRLLPILLLVAAAPVPTPMRDRLIAEAGALTPERLDFERTTKTVRTGGGTTTRVEMVERWNGKAWSLVSLAGASPTNTARQEHRRAVRGVPVPGYHRLAPLLAAATAADTDAEGRAIWQIPVLPAGSVYTDSGDISAYLKADLRVVQSGNTTFVDQIHITARAPFKMNLLIRVLDFDQVADYQLGSDGKPRLMSQKSESKGTMFGFPGGEKGVVTFVHRLR